MTETNTCRLIGVVTVKNGWAVQSVRYKDYLPIGDPVTLVRTLGRWGLDEVFVLAIDRTASNLGPDLDLLRKISRHVVGVPLTYCGGVQSKSQAIDVIAAGADRVGIDSLLRSNYREVLRVSESLGLQAVVGVFPLVKSQKGDFSVEVYAYLENTTTALAKELEVRDFRGSFSEALVIDVASEGTLKGFDISLLAEFKAKEIPTLVLGGIATPTQISEVINNWGVQGVCIENSLFYREHSPYYLRCEIAALRNPPSSNRWEFDAVL
jgi:cyclase